MKTCLISSHFLPCFSLLFPVFFAPSPDDKYHSIPSFATGRTFLNNEVFLNWFYVETIVVNPIWIFFTPGTFWLFLNRINNLVGILAIQQMMPQLEKGEQPNLCRNGCKCQKTRDEKLICGLDDTLSCTGHRTQEFYGLGRMMTSLWFLFCTINISDR